MNKLPLNQGPRLVIECSEEFKTQVVQIAAERGFTSYKNYLVHLIRNDIDGLTKPAKEKASK